MAPAKRRFDRKHEAIGRFFRRSSAGCRRHDHGAGAARPRACFQAGNPARLRGRPLARRRSLRAGLPPSRDRAGGRTGPPTVAAAAGARGGDFAGDRVGLADHAAARVPHQVDVDVIVVIGVRAWRQDGGEHLAGRALYVVQEALLFRWAVPALFDCHLAPVSESEGCDVERIAEGVLGNVGARIAVHARSESTR